MSGERFIKVVEVELKDPSAISLAEAAKAGFRVSDDRNYLIMTTLDFLCGFNPWGLHNDMLFTMDRIKGDQCDRIVEAAEETKNHWDEEAHLGDYYVKIAAADFEPLLHVIEHPSRHQHLAAIPPGVYRAARPILEGIKNALTEDPSQKKTEEKPAEAEPPAAA
jgi:hypothetical protein